MKKLVILDGNALMHRAFHAITPLTNSRGVLINVVYGFASTILSILQDEMPEYFVVAFDTKAKTFRKEKCETYKAGRVKPSDDFYSQIPLVHAFLESFGIQKLECDGYEGDDLLAMVAKKCHERGDLNTVVVTSDRDALQLVNEKVWVHDLAGGYSRAKVFTIDSIWEKYGVYPDQFVDYKGLIGDSSDNLPGVKGIGPKTAARLLQRYKTLEAIYDNLEQLQGKEREKLELGKGDAFFTQEMAKLQTEIPCEFDIENHLTEKFKPLEAEKFLAQEMEINSLVGRLHGWIRSKSIIKSNLTPEEQEILIEIEKSEQKIKKPKNEDQLSLF